jgi:hypothetical protein
MPFSLLLRESARISLKILLYFQIVFLSLVYKIRIVFNLLAYCIKFCTCRLINSVCDIAPTVVPNTVVLHVIISHDVIVWAAQYAPASSSGFLLLLKPPISWTIWPPCPRSQPLSTSRHPWDHWRPDLLYTLSSASFSDNVSLSPVSVTWMAQSPENGQLKFNVHSVFQFMIHVS